MFGLGLSLGLDLTLSGLGLGLASSFSGLINKPRYKLYALVAVNMYLVSATKLSPVCRRYKKHVDGDKCIQLLSGNM